jgi:hypothetical protein
MERHRLGNTTSVHRNEAKVEVALGLVNARRSSTPHSEEKQMASNRSVKRVSRYFPVLTECRCTLIAAIFTIPGSVGRLHQPWTLVGRRIVRTTSGAAVVPDPDRLKASNADNTTSFDDHAKFHEASLERPPEGDNALFGEATPTLRVPVRMGLHYSAPQVVRP